MSTTAPQETRHSLRPKMHQLATEIFEYFAQNTKDTEGVSRPAYSDIETQSLAYLDALATRYGLCVQKDTLQNSIYCLPEHATQTPYILVASHIDSVPQGGNFDGLAGIVGGLLCLIEAKQTQKQLPMAVRVMALRGEESAWFGPCYMASKALLGKLSREELTSKHKTDGHTLERAMQAVGIDTAPIAAGTPLLDTSEVYQYLELHIEQGPLLVEKDLPAAVVSGIRGNFRHKKLRCIGEAGHSGAVPRAYRHDPVFALADLLTRLDESWLTILQKGSDMVLTSGIVGTDPARHAMTRIPDEVSFSLDIRSQSIHVLNAMRALLREEMCTLEKDRGVRFELDEEHAVAPALCDDYMVAQLSASMADVVGEPFVMASGAGHDAAVFANEGVASAMVFVRNANGSHNPLEQMEISDFMVATAIIYDYLGKAHP
ncbi:Zn-dependent hydrolase [Polycladidibacter stylochi]|uniref:Zn-dependent hydrolase n=1 Tax=Polycladidibacter stylochi TaxID=1807766 RepID=UPI000830976A|nr:Zn-dependent hydrolase [Pseudovibrio stylochi]